MQISLWHSAVDWSCSLHRCWSCLHFVVINNK